jgi:hypothetical protein
MTEKVSDLPVKAKEILTEVLKDKGSWVYKKGVILGPNMYTIRERYYNLWEWEWQELIFFPLYFRMLHLLRLVKDNDKEWYKNHIHVTKVNGEDQEYFECFGDGDCDVIINEKLERVQYQYRLNHAKLWEPITITDELVKEMGIRPESQLTML